MSQRLDHFLGQSPRYILLPEEGRVIRFAGPQNLPWEEDTKIKNISVKGLFFSIPKFFTPHKGEEVKIEFELPQIRKIACYGKVVSILPEEDLESENCTVEIEFIDLNAKQKVALKESLGYIVNKENIHDTEFNFWSVFTYRKVVGLILLSVLVSLMITSLMYATSIF